MSDANMSVKVTADTGQAKGALDALKNDIKSVGSIMGSELMSGMGWAQTWEKAARMVKEAIMDVANEGKTLIRQAREFNMSVQEAQRFTDEMEELGVGAGLAVRVKRSSEKFFAEAKRKPTGKQAMLSEQIGLSAEEIDKMSKDGNYALQKLREIYQSFKSEEEAAAFGLSMFGTAFVKWRPYLESSAEESKDASAGVSRQSDMMALSGKNLVNTLDDLWDRFKDLIQPLVPVASFLAELTNIIAVGLVTGLKVAWSAFMVLVDVVLYGYNEMEASFRLFCHDINNARKYLPTWLGGLSDEDVAKNNQDFAEYVKGYEETQESLVNNMIVQADNFAKASEKGNELIVKSMRNMKTAVVAEAEKMGIYKEGQNANEFLQEIEKKRQLKAQLEKEAKELGYKRKTDYLQMNTFELNSNIALERRKLEDAKKLGEEIKEEQSHFDSVYKVRQGFSSTGMTFKDTDALEKERKKSVEDLAKTQKAAEAEANTSTEKRIAKIKENIETLKKNRDEEEARNKQIGDVYAANVSEHYNEEILATEKRLHEATNKLREEKKKQAQEDIEYNKKVKNQMVGLNDKYNKLELEKIKAQGKSAQELKQKEFEDSYAEVERLQKEFAESYAEFEKNKYDKANREAMLQAAKNLQEKSIEVESLIAKDSGKQGNVIASDMAKKGLGGGMTMSMGASLLSVAKKQYDTLREISSNGRMLNEKLGVSITAVPPDNPKSTAP